MSAPLLKRNSSTFHQSSQSIYPLFVVIYNNEKMKISPNQMQQIFTKETFKCLSIRLHLRKWNYRVQFMFQAKETRNEAIEIFKRVKDKYDFNFYYYFQRGYCTYSLLEEWEYRNAINFSNSYPGFGENDKNPAEFIASKNQKNVKENKLAQSAAPKQAVVSQKIEEKQKKSDQIQQQVEKKQEGGQQDIIQPLAMDAQEKQQKEKEQAPKPQLSIEEPVQQQILQPSNQLAEKQVVEQLKKNEIQENILEIQPEIPEKNQESTLQKPIQIVDAPAPIQSIQGIQQIEQKVSEMIEEQPRGQVIIVQSPADNEICQDQPVAEIDQVELILSHEQMVRKLLKLEFMLLDYLD